MMKKEKKKEQVQDMTQGEQPSQSKGKRIASTVVNVILVLAIILAAVCTYVSYVSTSGNGVPSILGVRMFSIQTDSMYPELNPGDMVFGKAVPDAGKLEVGDVITYWTIIDGQRVLNTHRITEIYDGGNSLIFQTKGDKNTVEDALTVHESAIVAQYTGHKIGGLGKVFDYLQTSTGFLIVVVLPVAIFFLYHLIQFFRVLFEYQSVKQKLMYEMERGKTEDLLDEEKVKMEAERKKERERLEAELRERLKQELQEAKAPEAPAPEEPEPPAPELTEEEKLAAERAAMEEKIRAEMKAEAEAKAAAEAEEQRRAAMEAEIRAKIKAEMEAEKDQK